MSQAAGDYSVSPTDLHRKVAAEFLWSLERRADQSDLAALSFKHLL